MPSSKKKNSFNFEQSLQELTALVDKMEQGHLSLEDSLQHFESGIKLIRQCQQTLATAEQKVQILTQRAGQEMLEDFTEDD